LGSTKFNGRTITLSKGPARANKKRLLLPDSFSDNLVVRTWRPGDKIKSSCGTKKVQDVFVDAKVNKEERMRWPIITHNEEIIWIPLLQAAEIKKGNKNLTLEVK
jgi:tRNA(Ile)-lysidine synthetase-like protein